MRHDSSSESESDDVDQDSKILKNESQKSNERARVRHDSSSESENDDNTQDSNSNGGKRPRNASELVSGSEPQQSLGDMNPFAEFDMGDVYLPPGAEEGGSDEKNAKEKAEDAEGGEKDGTEHVKSKENAQEKPEESSSSAAFDDFDMGAVLLPPGAEQTKTKDTAKNSSKTDGAESAEASEGREKTPEFLPGLSDFDMGAVLLPPGSEQATEHPKGSPKQSGSPNSSLTKKDGTSPKVRKRKSSPETSDKSTVPSKKRRIPSRSPANDRRSPRNDRRRSRSTDRRSPTNYRRSRSFDRSDDNEMRDSDAEFNTAPTDFVWPERKDGDGEFPHLPIHDVEEDVLRLIRENNMCVITGDTGSGKSTQLAQFLARAGFGQIAVTQPRRVGVRFRLLVCNFEVRNCCFDGI